MNLSPKPKAKGSVLFGGHPCLCSVENSLKTHFGVFLTGYPFQWLPFSVPFPNTTAKKHIKVVRVIKG
ncbi:MAG: hypothetical protein KAR13_13565, partial [Desulfobulbaceae bacterium]|nr:hypothetical protein [Desulfobulbaceae bacterium]